MKTTTLKTCQTPFEANLIKAKLEAAGIPSFLTNENYSTLYPVMANLLGSGVRVLVNDEDLENALELLADEFESLEDEGNQ